MRPVKGFSVAEKNESRSPLPRDLNASPSPFTPRRKTNNNASTMRRRTSGCSVNERAAPSRSPWSVSTADFFRALVGGHATRRLPRSQTRTGSSPGAKCRTQCSGARPFSVRPREDEQPARVPADSDQAVTSKTGSPSTSNSGRTPSPGASGAPSLPSTRRGAPSAMRTVT